MTLMPMIRPPPRAEGEPPIDIGSFRDFLFPIIRNRRWWERIKFSWRWPFVRILSRNPFPSTPINDLVAVQPLAKPKGRVFTFRYTIGRRQ